jgi:hypothetical protein
MATTRTFQAMLNEYLPNELMKEELIARDYILKSVNKDDKWGGGALIVPFKSAGASSIKFGGLTDSTDISQSKYTRGSISGYREVWGSLVFNEADLMEHGKISEQNFLRLLPDELEDFMQYKKEVVSIQLGSGPQFATVKDQSAIGGQANPTAGGLISVDKIDRFQIDQKIVLDDNDSAAVSVYVTAVNVNTKTITVSATRGGAALDVSAYTVAQAAKIYHDGVFDAGGNHDTFISMRQALLSAVNGGTTNIHGVAKTSAPILQAVNINGSTITAANILDKLFDAYTEARERSKGLATEYLMSYKHFGTCMKLLELNKGAYRVVEAPKESLYGWSEMTIANVSGRIVKLVGIQEMDDDIIPMVDWRSITFRSNGYFKKRKGPDGLEYFTLRAQNGYSYICDTVLFGEMEYKKPGHSAIIHTISY